MMAACAVSIGVGMSLVWHLMPEALRQANTAELVAVLGLFLLPVATVFAFTMERSARRGAARADAGGGWGREPGPEPGARAAEPDGAWAPVWAAVMAGERAAETVRADGGTEGQGTGAMGARREAGHRRRGNDAGSRRRRDGEAVGAAGAGVR
jgi:hypothetical protein